MQMMIDRLVEKFRQPSSCAGQPGDVCWKLLAIFGLVLAGLGGCKEEPIQVYDVPKSPVTVAVADKPEKAADWHPVEVGAMKASIPSFWLQDPKPRMMREATFLVGPAERKTEVIITKLNGPSGELLGNVNRWRAQVGLPPIAAVNEADVPKVKVAGGDATLFDFAGPDEKAPNRRLIQVVSPRPDGSTYFVKIIGDAALVADQKAAFDRFVASIDLAK